MPVTTNNAAARLNEVIEFDFSKPLTKKVREELSLKLSDQFLTPLTEVIEKFTDEEGNEKEEEYAIDDELNIIETMENYLKSPTITKIVRYS